MLGTGILRGLYITAKNLAGSFFDRKERLTTIQYPDEPARIPRNYRNFPFLIQEDGPDAKLRCVACGMCERECPPQCIYIVRDKVERVVDGKKTVEMRPKVFDLDTSVCMGCGICVEVCPSEAIKMDQVFEIAVADRFYGLLQHKEQLAKPDSYYHEIHPEDAARTDAVLEEGRRKKAAAAAAAAAAARPAVKPAAPDAAPTPVPASAPAPKAVVAAPAP